jgi:Ca2+-binding RTX toxin-like protein
VVDLRHAGGVAVSQLGEATPIRALHATADASGAPVLLALAPGGGLVRLALTPAGAVPAGFVATAGLPSAGAHPAIVTLTDGDGPDAVAFGAGDGAATAFSLGDGALGEGAALFRMAQSDRVLAADAAHGRLALVSADGVLTVRAAATPDRDLARIDLGAARPAAAVAVAAPDLVVVVDPLRVGIEAYRLTDGALSRTGRVTAEDGIAFAVPTAVAVAETGGQRFAIVADAGTGSLIVLAISGSGALSATDHVLDGRSTRFAEATLLKTVEVEGWTIVAAAGSDDGLSLFALLPGGRLLHLDTIATETGGGDLTDLAALDLAMVGSVLHVFGVAEGATRITAMTADLSGLGQILAAAEARSGALTGTEADDVLVASRGARVLSGEAGADVFVFDGTVEADGGMGRILDFDPGTDRLNLSALPFLYDATMVEVRPTAFGATLHIGDRWLELHRAGGGRIEPEELGAQDLLGAQHLPITTVSAPVGTGDLVLYGTSGSDRLMGGDGHDSLEGRDGADTLNGGDGRDTILGGATDRDLRDLIYGGSGHDVIDAGAGNDAVYGMAGDDTIAGGPGVDELYGQAGDDVITGSAFSDLVFGGTGADFVNGGWGHDRVNGGQDADTFFHAGVAGHGSDWIQDYSAAEGDRLRFGGTAEVADFGVTFAHTADAEGRRAGDGDIMEAFVLFRPTGQILWALVDGEAEARLDLMIGAAQTPFDLL